MAESPQEETPEFIDAAQFALFLDGSPEDRKELAELFLEQAETNLLRLYHSCAGQPTQEWKAAAHRFKGASANLGARELAALAAEAEGDDSGDASERRRLLMRIEEALGRVRQVLMRQTGGELAL